VREGIGITSSADVVASALLQVLFDQGWDKGQQPVRLRAMLNDLLGASAVDHEAAVDALVVGAELGAAAAASTPSEGQTDAVTARLTEWGLAAETAAWVRGTWSWAYRQLVLDTPTAEFSDETIVPPAASETDTELPDENRPGQATMPFAVTAPSSEQPPTLAASEIAGLMLGSSFGATKDGDQSTEPVAEPLGPTSPATGTRHLTRRHIAIASAAAVVLIGGLIGTAVAAGRSSPGPSAKGSSGDPVKTASATAAHTTKTSSSTVSTTTTSTTTSSSTPATSGQSTPSPGATPSARTPASTGKSVNVPGSSGSPAAISPASAAPAPTTTTSTPTTTTTTTPPPPPPPVASDWSIAYTPEYGSGQFYISTESAAQISQDVSGSWSYLVVLNPGNTTYYDLIDTSGSNYLQWQPNYNGAGYLHVYYYVVNAEGERSNQATLTVNVNCNPNTQCNAPAPPG
jgi:hypothetical protein